MILTPEDKLELRVMETKHGWAYAIVSNGGIEPGSLHAFEATQTMSDAIDQGGDALVREIKIRDCEHDWSGTLGSWPLCVKCNIVQYNEKSG